MAEAAHTKQAVSASARLRAALLMAASDGDMVAFTARQARELLDEIDACRMAVSAARQGSAKTRAEPQARFVAAALEWAIGTVRTVAVACVGAAIGASVVTLMTVIAWAGK